MSFLDAMNDAEEPVEIFHVGKDEDSGVWKTMISEKTVEDIVTTDPEANYFVAKEEEVFD